ncbi:hypothetical protein [Azospirillum largimobile]
MATPFDYLKKIPTGTELRILLSSERVSYGDIQDVLKMKGIFVANSDKSITVPLLSATILTPSEFNYLIEQSVDREQRPKTKISSIELTGSGGQWSSTIRGITSESIIGTCKLGGNISFVDPPKIIFIKKNEVKIPYKVRRKDFSKDWIEREIIFSGEINLQECGENLKLEVSSSHTCRETDEINKSILRTVINELKREGITSQEKPKSITFGDCNCSGGWSVGEDWLSSDGA